MHQAAARRARDIVDSPLLNAFALSQEPDALRKEYGPGFGQRCLLSRRLVAAGCPFVEIGLPGWNASEDYFSEVRRLSGELDAGMGSLLADLRRTGLIDQTLVVCAGPHGRSPTLRDGKSRDAQARGWSVALAGGPIQGGRVYGDTGPEGSDCTNPVGANVLFGTIYAACGINAGKRMGVGYCVDKYVYPYSKGVTELLPP